MIKGSQLIFNFDLHAYPRSFFHSDLVHETVPCSVITQTSINAPNENEKYN